MWTVWSLENDLVTRRLHEDPGIIGDGDTEALLGSLDRVWDPEVPVRPRGLLSGTRRSFLLVLGPRLGPRAYVVIRRFSSQIRRSWLEPGGFYGCDWTLRSHKSAWLFLRSGDRIGTLVHQDPEVVWEPGGPLGM